jgi:hypothetical protein
MLTRFLAVAIVTLPTVALILSRRRLGTLEAASWLVIWGVVIVVGEHAGWAIRLSIHERGWTNPHSTIHYFMSGVYAVVGGVLLGVIARSLLREGRRAGWYAVLFALVVGGTLELLMNGPAGLLYHHGFAPNTTPGGEALYGYLVAWTAALALAHGPVFRRSARAASVSPNGRTAMKEPAE